jgi:flagellar biosynthesis repressor protein FlbT
MSAPMRITLRAGERIYINGAVLRAERKLSFELLNNASFLLENHIIQAEEATTPLRQLYFALQTLLIEPGSEVAKTAYACIFAATQVSFSTTDVVVGLRLVGRLADAGRIYEALKTLRNLFAVEAAILETETFTRQQEATQEQHDGREQHRTDGERDGFDFRSERGERRKQHG